MDLDTGVEIDASVASPIVNLTTSTLSRLSNLTNAANATNNTAALLPFPQNATIPWDDQEAMNDLIQAWVRFERLPPSTMIVKGVAVGVFFLAYAVMSYASWSVLATIAIGEAPQAVLYQPRDKNQSRTSKKDDDDYDEEQDRTRYEWPYTSSLRKLLFRLTTQAGPTSVLRGICCLLITGGVAAVIVYPTILWSLAQLLRWIPSGELKATYHEDGRVTFSGWKDHAVTEFILGIFEHILLSTLLAPCDVTHTHIVVTVHSWRTWVRRIPPAWSTIKAMALPMAVAVVVDQVNHHLTHFLGWLLAVPRQFSQVQGWWQSLLFAVMFCLVWVFRLAVKLPVLIALRRVKISLLKEEEETLIPVDRSFGSGGMKERTEGYTAPGILARPHEKVTFVQAWRSVVGTKEARRGYVQLLMLFAKMVALQAGLILVSYLLTGVDVLVPGAWWDPGPEI